MKVSRKLFSFLCVALLVAAEASAANLTISVGIRETAGDGPAFDNGGSGGGIEWVNLDGQTLAVDGTWQTFTFTPSVDTLTAFAGSTANGALEAGDEWATLEHIRILNSDGITLPVILWIDDVTVTEAAGSTVEGFEGFAVDDEVMFQEPGLSGSTSGNILPGSTAGVTDGMANSGSQSYRADFQYVDNTPTRWVRLTTFNTGLVGNPEIRIVEPGGPAPTLSITLKAATIPEPATGGLLLLGAMGMVLARRNRA